MFISILTHYTCPSGDIQIGMVDKKGALEVEVIRARGLVGKPGSKSLPGNSSSDAAVLTGRHHECNE